MKSRRLVLGVLSMAVCIILLAAVVPVQAHEPTVGVPVSGEELASGKVLATVGIQARGGLMTNVVLYDQEWGVVAQAAGHRGEVQFEAVKPGAYHLVAYNDELDTWASKDIEVQPAQTLQVALYPKRIATETVETAMEAIAPKAAAATIYNSGTCGAASGDGRFLKIYPSFGQTIIYLQCGRVVGKVEAGGCQNCGLSGGWRYTTDCKKSAPIYVNLPCPRGRP